jgi:hypothetical protein
MNPGEKSEGRRRRWLRLQAGVVNFQGVRDLQRREPGRAVMRLPLLIGLLLCGGGLASSRWSLAADGGVSGDAGTGGAGAAAKTPPAPSLSQTGTVGSVGLQGQAPVRTLGAKPRLESRPEKAVSAPKDRDDDTGARSASPPKNLLPRVLQQQVTGRLRSLGACRRDVARDRHVPMAQLAAGSLLLRWTIEATGTVSAPEVVEQTSVDPAIMECVKRAIASWAFSPPDKGPLPVERRYQFGQAK